MSTSSKSPHHDKLALRRRHWVAGGAAAIALALTIIWVGASRAPTTELRVGRTSSTLSAQLIDGAHVILFANAEGPTDARATLGILRRPWERRPTVVVADARESIAAGLWETLQRESPAQLIVLGAPGDSDAWLAIERHCRSDGIEVRYLESVTRLQLDRLALTLAPTDDGSYALISDGSLQVALSLGGLPETGRQHALISADDPPPSVSTDLQILAGGDGAAGATHHLRVADGRRVTLVFENGRLRVRGGTLLD